jgi:hypothetical protein
MLVGVVKRNACKDKAVLQWLDSIVQRNVAHKKSVRVCQYNVAALFHY